MTLHDPIHPTDMTDIQRAIAGVKTLAIYLVPEGSRGIDFRVHVAVPPDMDFDAIEHVLQEALQTIKQRQQSTVLL